MEGVKTYLGISFLVMGLFGLISGLFPLGLLFGVCGLILVNFFRESRSNQP